MIVIAGALLMLEAAAFDGTRFSIDADIEGLISEDLPWHQRELQLLHAFPQKGILVVVKAPTAENAEQATNALAQTLSKNHDLFPAVEQLDSGDFFERNGLLYQAPDDVRKSAEGLARAQPFIAALAGDPSVRGVMSALSSAVHGRRAGYIKLGQLAEALSPTEQTPGGVLFCKPAELSQQQQLKGHPPPATHLRAS